MEMNMVLEQARKTCEMLAECSEWLYGFSAGHYTIGHTGPAVLVTDKFLTEMFDDIQTLDKGEWGYRYAVRDGVLFYAIFEMGDA